MKFIQWNENLLVNIEEIDNQHKNIFKLINNLHDKLRKGEGITVIKPTLNSLIEYVINHFSTEEKWMKKVNFPEIEKHTQEHQKYITEIKGLINKYEDRDRMPLLARDILISLGSWYRIHIEKYDIKIGQFLKDQNII